MYVVATAGHVDHGKSTLVKALTGMEPDRLTEEKAQGMSIVLGYAWTDLEDIGRVGFIDVPGHHRLLETSIAGLGTAQAVLFVVGADDPWMPQAEEHLQILDALGLTQCVVAITRSDLADPDPTIAVVRAALNGTTLAGSPIVPVSARTGAGLQELRHTLGTVLNTLPHPDHNAGVRLWIDREFTIKGAGSVVTGSLLSGIILQGQSLESGPGQTHRVRRIQISGQTVPSAEAPTRVALNIAGTVGQKLRAGNTLTRMSAWHYTDTIDIWADPTAGRIPAQAHLHIGTASRTARVRPLGLEYFRLKVERPLPLHIGDPALLRNPSTRQIWPIRVLDPAPPELTRRGAASDRANTLSLSPASPSLAYEVETRGVVRTDHLRRLGVPIESPSTSIIEAHGWLLSHAKVGDIQQSMAQIVESTEFEGRGVPLTVLATRLNVPAGVLAELVQAPLASEGSVVHSQLTSAGDLEIEGILTTLGGGHSRPLLITIDELETAGLHTTLRRQAIRTNQLVAISPTRFALPKSLATARLRLKQLLQPFATSEARVALGWNRADTISLLEHFDRNAVTHRLPESTRRVH